MIVKTHPKSETERPHKHAQDCPCGCAPCPDECCNLPCLERPRFFCGQLLTDADLTALVEWSRDKFRLTRYRHGWGVVCGLEVHCDPKSPTGVMVRPGYAIDCCGEDIVACQPGGIDLADVCEEEICEDPWERQRKENPDRKARTKRQNEERLAAYEAPENESKLSLNWKELLDVQRLTPVDLYIHYRSEDTLPVAVLSSRACGQRESCQESRTRDTYTLRWQTPTSGEDPDTLEALEWRKAYQERADELARFVNRFTQTAQSGGDLQQVLTPWLKKYPLHQFCFVPDLLDSTRTDRKLQNPHLSLALFYLMMDYTLQGLTCDCSVCKKDTGVPLARIWLQQSDPSRGKACKVLAIDNHPPFRRMIRPDKCWPAAPGCFNLGQLIWQTPVDAKAALQKAGIPNVVEEYIDPSNFQPMRLLESCDVIQACQEDQQIYMLVVKDDSSWGGWVAGFCTKPTQNYKKPSGLAK